MNKTELVAALAEKTQLPKKNAELALNAVVEVITESPVSYTHLTLPTSDLV